MYRNACILGNKQEELELCVPSQKYAAKDLHNLSREDKQGKGTREDVALYKQEQLGYMGLLYMMDSSLGESLQVRVSREATVTKWCHCGGSFLQTTQSERESW